MNYEEGSHHKTASFFLLISIVLAGPGRVICQDLPFDEVGNIHYSGVVKVEKVDGKHLFDVAKQYMSTLKVPDSNMEYLQFDTSTQTVSTRYGFFLLSNGGLTKKVDVRIDCRVKIDTKDEKYRYAIDQFFYTDYQKDRYGKIKAVKSSSQPLEKVYGSRKSRLWGKYFTIIDEMTQSLVARIKSEMKRKPWESASEDEIIDW
jgi:hypothetical protein